MGGSLATEGGCRYRLCRHPCAAPLRLSVPNRKSLLAVLGLFELIHEGDCIILHRDAALLLVIGDQFIFTQPEFAGSLTRFEESSRRQIGPIDFGCPKYIQNALVRLG